MDNQLQEFNQLTSDTAEYLRSVHGFSTWTIGHYKGGWRIIREYMVAKGIKHYRPSIGKKVLSARFNNRSIRDLSSTEKQIYNSIVRLSEFQANGKIDLHPSDEVSMLVKNLSKLKVPGMNWLGIEEFEVYYYDHPSRTKG